MKKIAMIAAFMAAGAALARSTDAEIERRVDDLVGRMTVAEKIGQLTQMGGLALGVHGHGTNMNEIALDKIKADIRSGAVGSYIIKMRQHKFGSREMHNILQKVAVEESRLGIPLLFADDMVHGTYTCFPNALGLACAFDPSLFERTMRFEALEARWAGFDWVYGPVADTARDPRWGRIAEGCGEDPYLNGLCIAAAVRGLQGDGDPTTTVLATPKHFTGYSAVEGGIDYGNTEVSEWTMRNVHLPPFRAAVEAGALSLMSSLNSVDGIPAVASRHLLTEVLREQWGFRGFVISDAGAVWRMLAWNYADSPGEAVNMAWRAGNDVEMGDVGRKWMNGVVKDPMFDERALDECVRRFLRVKFLRGLFDSPYLPPLPDERAMAKSEAAAQALARECAQKSAVLIKNNDVLPLKRSLKKVAVVGPFGDNRSAQIGCWMGLAQFGSPCAKLGEALRDALGGKVEVVVVKGCNWLATQATVSRAEDGEIIVDRNAPAASAKLDSEQVLKACSDADVVVVAVGEAPNYTGEGGSRATLGLTGRQQELFDIVAETGKPIVAVVTSGRPLAIPEVYEKSSAVVCAFFLGCEGNAALADLLTGKASFEGRLSVSIPYSVGHLPCFYNRHNTGNPRFHALGYRDVAWGRDPLYPFGFGLSYAKFRYGPTTYDPDGRTASCEIVNEGKVPGVVKPQLYIQQMSCHEGARPMRELRGFDRIELKPGERRNVSFRITDETLRYHNRAGGYSTDCGGYQLKISDDALSGTMVPFDWKGEK